MKDKRRKHGRAKTVHSKMMSDKDKSAKKPQLPSELMKALPTSVYPLTSEWKSDGAVQ